MKNRGSGILLHITSLPSPYGIGDLGPWAYRFADFLTQAGQTYWQVLPLTPTDQGSGNSPYSSLSAFAGNTLLISPELLCEAGLLSREEISPPPFSPGSDATSLRLSPIRRNCTIALTSASGKIKSIRPLLMNSAQRTGPGLMILPSSGSSKNTLVERPGGIGRRG